jgi:hypothetical protein
MIAIPRNAPATLAWIAVAAHLVVGVVSVASRRPAGLPTHPLRWLLPALNLIVAACVLAYWARAWYGYATRGVTWYASDQLVPLYAAAIAVASALTLAGRFDGRVGQSIQWLAFGVDALAVTAAALYLTFMRIDRLF